MTEVGKELHAGLTVGTEMAGEGFPCGCVLSVGFCLVVAKNIVMDCPC